MAPGYPKSPPDPDPSRFLKKAGPASPSRRRASSRAANRAPAESPRSETERRTAGSSKPDRLPGWRELSESNDRESQGRRHHWTLVEAIPTFRLAAAILAFGVVTTLYVGHVLATQDLMARAEALRRENLALHLRSNRVKGAFDQASGPTVIYERARALGLTQQIPNGPIIELD